MTGAKHYEMAEQLIQEYVEGDSNDDQVLSVAHVHATLAFAAAAAGIDGGWSRSAADRDDWKRVLFPELVDA